MKFLAHSYVICPACNGAMRKLDNGNIACAASMCSEFGIQFEAPYFELRPANAFPLEADNILKATAADEPDIVSAMMAVDLPPVGADGVLPTDIQWMPPGKHPIKAHKNGKTFVTTMNVTADTAARVQAAFAAQHVKAKAGEDDETFLDFNHEDGEASAHPTEFYWGGDDPKTGGVRCKLVWTEAGASAVKGRSFRRFSPQFTEDGKGNVTGLPVNAGGLVNRAAFKKISALAAKDSPATNPTQHSTNMKLIDLLKKHGLIADTGLEESEVVSQVSAKLAEYGVLTIKNGELTTKVTDLEGVITKAKETHADSVISGLVKAGAIPPKDTVLQARYKKLLIEDPENETILPKAPNGALNSQIVKAKRNETAGEDLGTDDLAEPLIVKAKEMVKADPDLDLSDAIVKACEDDEEAYNNFRYSNGLGDEKSRKAFATGRN